MKFSSLDLTYSFYGHKKIWFPLAAAAPNVPQNASPRGQGTPQIAWGGGSEVSYGWLEWAESHPFCAYENSRWDSSLDFFVLYVALWNSIFCFHWALSPYSSIFFSFCAELLSRLNTAKANSLHFCYAYVSSKQWSSIPRKTWFPSWFPSSLLRW